MGQLLDERTDTEKKEMAKEMSLCNKRRIDMCAHQEIKQKITTRWVGDAT
jgi:hypothetical protein